MRASSLHTHYDVIVIGGGLVGASFACALNAQIASAGKGVGMKILVTEAVESLQASPSFDARSTALSYGSQQLYERMNLWQQLAPHATPIHKIHVSDRGHFGAVRIDNATMGVDALGHVVENQHLGIVLTAALEQAVTVDFLCPAKIASIEHRPEGMALRISDVGAGELEVTTTLVVLADGGKSGLSEQLGISSNVNHYGQKAIIGNVAFEHPHANVAYERFTDSGPLAVLPLADFSDSSGGTGRGDNRGALIWTVSADESDAVMALPEAEFLAALQQRFGYRLGQFQKVGARIAYPLSLAVAREQIRPGLVLLGNVAHTLHPVAGQGLNLALRDAQTLAELLASAHNKGLSVGSMAVLRGFVNAQRPDQDMTIDFSHYMTQLFSSANVALVWARKFGLFSIDLLPVAKKAFARRAMGLAERRAAG